MTVTTGSHHYESRWAANVEAVRAWAAKHGSPMAPAGATIRLRDGRTANVGTFVAYARARHRKGLLDARRARELSRIPGWTWDRLQPGPKGKESRNEEIRRLRSQGVTLAEIAEKYGMSRQRVHQIAPDSPDEAKHEAHLARRRHQRTKRNIEEMRAASRAAKASGVLRKRGVR
jgi:hypothetical protein